MKTYLVTGGAGFIGSTLIERLLKENYRVICIDNFCDFYDSRIKEDNIKSFNDNSNFILYREDIRNKEGIKKVFKESNIDCVIHLAAMAGVRPSIDNPILYHEVNVMGTLNILENMKEHNIKNFILASSSSVYGNTKEVPFREDMIVDYPISPYASTKKEDEVNTIALRFFTVYGSKQRPDLAISKFTKLMLNNEEIPMYGDGNSFRDYTYVDDIVDGIIKSISYLENNKNVYEIINLGSSNPISLNQMINVIGEQLNIEPKIKVMDNQIGDVEKTYADITKAKRLINYDPKTSFESGIKKFIGWYNKSLIDKIKCDKNENYITKELREKINNFEKLFQMNEYEDEKVKKEKELRLKFKRSKE